MEKPAGALDFDDTIGPFAVRFLAYVNLKEGTDYRPEGVIDHDLGVSFGQSMKEFWYPHIMAFADYEREQPLMPMDGAVEVIGRLATQYELVIITARPEEHSDIVEDFVETHLADYVSDIITRSGSHATFDKGAVMAHIGAEFLVDDHHVHVDNAINRGRQGVLFGDLPKTVAHKDRLPHAKTWYEVEALLEE